MGTWTATFFALTGGGKRDRTADLLHAMQALSQLSYTPKFESRLFSLRLKVLTSVLAPGTARSVSTAKKRDYAHFLTCAQVDPYMGLLTLVTNFLPEGGIQALGIGINTRTLLLQVTIHRISKACMG